MPGPPDLKLGSVRLSAPLDWDSSRTGPILTHLWVPVCSMRSGTQCTLVEWFSKEQKGNFHGSLQVSTIWLLLRHLHPADNRLSVIICQ